MSSLNQLVPRHVAIILDGNGRWARSRGYGRFWGHRQGARRVDEIITHCRNSGVRYLTLYAFSTENWNRPASEVSMLMKLLVGQLRIMDKMVVKNRVRLRVQGDMDRLPPYVQRELRRTFRMCESFEPAMELVFALSYGGRQEIVQAVKQVASEVAAGKLDPANITEPLFRSRFQNPDVPDPDLLIRTGGEQRISNFLLYQCAYTEFYFTDVLWPDFDAREIEKSFEVYRTRERRFGMTSAQVAPEPEGASRLLEAKSL